MDTVTHYDMLIDEGNDSFRDCPELQSYMDKWDGKPFIDALKLDKSKKVLEIGIGTGRLAAKTAPKCKTLTGIDISPKTIIRASENLIEHSNIKYICDDFMKHRFAEKFDIIYCSLTSMHFEDKSAFVARVSALLEPGGIFCISLDKNQSRVIDMGSWKLAVYPDNPQNIRSLSEKYGMKQRNLYETELAYIAVFEASY